MKQKYSPLVQASELGSLNNLVLIDVRTGPDARDRYRNEHLAGASFVDLNEDLADIKPDPADGGRHPLPSVDKFADLLRRLGISPESRVVVYDDKNGANAAARFWWMLRAAGHEAVQILDGGYQAAVDSGVPVRSGEEEPAHASGFSFAEWSLPTAEIDEVEAARRSDRSIVIDVREPDRFEGLREPFDLVAGHIPGAINVPFAENLDESGRFLSPDRLREKYSAVLGTVRPEDSIVHCGSGVTACHTLLAFELAGLEIPKLYVGSWSEWSRSNRPRTP